MQLAILRVSAIGDVAHTLPAVALLRHHFPHATLHWIVQEKAASLLHITPLIDHVWQLPNGYLKPRNWGKSWQKLRPLRQIQFDAIIDFQGLLKTSLLGLALRGQRFGFAAAHAREPLASLTYHQRCTPVYTNIIQKNLALASLVVTRLAPTTRQSPTPSALMEHFRFSIAAPDRAAVDAWLTALPGQPLVISPNTTWASKHWPLERWAAFLRLAASAIAPRHPLVLLGEQFGPQGAALAKLIREERLPVVIAPPWRLEQVAYLLQHTALLIAPDTGILHLADSQAVPALGLFGPTLARRHGPFLKPSNAAQAIQVACPHLYQKSHTNKRRSGAKLDCMAKLTAEELTNAALGVLHGVAADAHAALQPVPSRLFSHTAALD